MEVNEAKKELLSYRNNLLYIELKTSKIQEERDRAEQIVGILTDMPTSHDNSIPDKRANSIVNIVDLTKEIEESIEFNNKLCIKIMNVIDELQQPYKNILHMKYIDGLSLKQIAHRLSYDKDYIAVLHGHALTQYAKIRTSH